jgi:3-deoxy-manno-octulosonate cytidylyltransferase (CMP-KDO synthetase)
VKVVRRDDGRALYFSRAPIPFSKHGDGAGILPLAWKHVGVYGFGRARLLEFASLPRSPLEEREGLEQLRALENGWPIRVLESAGNTLGINSPEDYERFVGWWREQAASGTKRKA